MTNPEIRKNIEYLIYKLETTAIQSREFLIVIKFLPVECNLFSAKKSH